MQFLSNNNTLTKTTTGLKYEYKSDTILINLFGAWINSNTSVYIPY